MRLFVTLVRFDVAYNRLFEGNQRRLADHPRLTEYTAQVQSAASGAQTVNLKHIKRGYYSIKALNPRHCTCWPDT